MMNIEDLDIDYQKMKKGNYSKERRGVKKWLE